MAITTSHLPKGPFSPALSSAGGTGELIIGRELVQHDLEMPFTRHVIQVFGWNTDPDGDNSNDQVICEVYVLGPAGEVAGITDDGWQLAGTLTSTAGGAQGPISGSHTLILDANTSGGISIESVSTGGFSMIRYPTKKLKLQFKSEGASWAAGLPSAAQTAVRVYVKSIQTLQT